MSDVEDRARRMLVAFYTDWMETGNREQLRNARLLSYVVTGKSSWRVTQRTV
jgi:hypothetical protein